MIISLTDLSSFVLVLALAHFMLLGSSVVLFVYFKNNIQNNSTYEKYGLNGLNELSNEELAIRREIESLRELMVTELNNPNYVDSIEDEYEEVENGEEYKYEDNFIPEHEVGQAPEEVEEVDDFDLRIEAIKKDLERKQEMPKEFFDYDEDRIVKDTGLYSPTIFEENDEVEYKAGTEIITEEYEKKLEERLK